jgi:hypothetical protein
MRKYCKEASVEKMFIVEMIGMKDIKLISNPIHMISHEFEVNTIMDPMINKE